MCEGRLKRKWTPNEKKISWKWVVMGWVERERKWGKRRVGAMA